MGIINFTRILWDYVTHKINPTNLNRIENGINDCANAINAGFVDESGVIKANKSKDSEKLGGKSPNEYLQKETIANNLTTIDEGYALDARQGKYLNDNKVDKYNGFPKLNYYMGIPQYIGFDPSKGGFFFGEGENIHTIYHQGNPPKLVEVLRSRGDLTALSTLSSNNITLDVDVAVGDSLLIEVNIASSYGNNHKIIPVTVGKTSTSSTTAEEYIVSFTHFDGTNMSVYSFSVARTDTKQLKFLDRKYINGSFSGTQISWTTGTYSLYVGRIWRLPK